MFNVSNDDNFLDNDCAYFESNDFNQLDLNSDGQFSIFYMNSRSLCRHYYDIQHYLCSLDHRFSVYGFTETWFKGAPPPYIHMDNYQLVHSSRSNKIGGGAAMFIHDTLKFRTRSDLMISSTDYECIFIEIERSHACNVIVGSVYRAPGTSLDNFLSSFDNCLNLITKELTPLNSLELY